MQIPKVFTQSASSALMLAQISAGSMGFQQFGSGHLLVGLCKCGDELTRCLMNETTSKDVEEEVSRQCGRGEVGVARISGMTPHAHRIMLRAVSYANPEKKTLAGTAHLWLELLHEDGCTAHSVLNALGISVEMLKTELENHAGEITRTEKAKAIPASNEPLVITMMHANREQAAQHAEENDPLNSYARNLTQEAKAQKLEPLIGRDAEINAMIRVLGKKTKNNPMLIGDPGVGKSAIVEGLAQRIADGNAPDMLKDVSIYALDLAQMVAGTKFRGEFEERIKRVLESIQGKQHAVLFIDEIHTLIGAGGSEGSLDAANILKPALARGQVRVIGATTYKEYRKYIEKDPALARRFQRIDIQEPDKAQTLEILAGLRNRYEAFHQIAITDEALLSAVELSDRYVTDRFMPDKAIDLIDEAASMAKLLSGLEASSVIPSSEYPYGQPSGSDETLPSRVEIKSEIGQTDIAKVVSEWTGIPLDHLCAYQQEKTRDLEQHLNSRVLGQDEAIRTLSKAIRRAQAGLNDPSRPLGVFMLLGPSGVGKTELCKALSEALFGKEEALIRMDMSEYGEEASATRLIGSPPGYVGHGEGGQLTDAVLKHPYSVVLFDEIEKAHPKIFNLLLQLLDDGHLTDSIGRRVNFKNTIIVMTSNAGISFDMDKQVGFGPDRPEDANEKRSRAILAKAKQVFRPEFLGRIDEMVVMHALSEETGRRIADLMLQQLKKRLGMRGVTLSYDSQVPAHLANLGVDAMSGARNLRRVIQEHVENPLSDLILSSDDIASILLAVQDGGIVLHRQQALVGAH